MFCFFKNQPNVNLNYYSVNQSVDERDRFILFKPEC